MNKIIEILNSASSDLDDVYYHCVKVKEADEKVQRAIYLLENLSDNKESKELKESKEQVDHPSHYNQGKFEVIDVIESEHFDFHLGNAFKYLSRAGKKDPSKFIEDLEKALWYLNRSLNGRNKKPVNPMEYINDMQFSGLLSVVINELFNANEEEIADNRNTSLYMATHFLKNYIDLEKAKRGENK